MQGGGAADEAEGGEQEDEEEEKREEEGEEEGPPECPICLTELEEDEDEVAVLVCTHTFHRACVIDWVQKSAGQGIEATCPMCRGAIMY